MPDMMPMSFVAAVAPWKVRNYLDEKPTFLKEAWHLKGSGKIILVLRNVFMNLRRYFNKFTKVYNNELYTLL